MPSSWRRSNHYLFSRLRFDAASCAEHGARTHDLPITRRELYQLSHRDRYFFCVVLTRGPWATSLTWVTLAHMKIFFEFKYTFHFLLPHLTLWSIDFNKLAMYYVRKLSCKFQLILTRVSQSPRGPLPTYWYTQKYRWNEARFQPVKYINGVPFSSNCYING